MELLGWVSAVLGELGAVLTLGGGEGLVAPPPRLALGIAVFAAVSTFAGHSVLIFLNGIRGLRALLALAIGVLFFLLLYLAQAVVIGLIAPLVTGTHLSLSEVAALSLAASAPLAFGVLEFLPHVGLFIGKVLQVWGALCLAALVGGGYHTSAWTAILLAGGAWLIMQLASRVLARPVGLAAAVLWRRVTGLEAVFTPADVLSGTPFIPVADPVVDAAARAGGV